MLKTAIAVTSLLFLAASFSSVARADVKAFHGATCEPTDYFDPASSWPQWQNVPDVQFSWFGVMNLDSGLRTFGCPLLRDNIEATNNLNQVVVEITNDSTGVDTISCTLFTQLEDRNLNVIPNYYDYQEKSTTTTGHVQLVFDDIDTSPGDEGSYYLECSINQFDIIAHVHVNEQN